MKTKLSDSRGVNSRLVSFENSNSWIKRFDSDGIQIIQAGYRENPGGLIQKDDSNPLVVIDNQNPRWYGSLACQGSHIRIHGRSKIETAREAFSACLRPADNGKDITVVASHWDVNALDSLKSALKGTYRVIRNGYEICCNVVKVEPILEGLGSYHLLKPSLNQGSTLLIELGYGTAEELVINEFGQVSDGRVVDSLGIFNLVNAIADDPTVRSLASSDSGAINPSLISASLKAETMGRIGASNWQAIKARYASEFLKSLQGRVTTHYSAQSQAITNVILTGGGAALLTAIQPKVSQVFTVPQQPQTASVRGAYTHYEQSQLSLIGVA